MVDILDDGEFLLVLAHGTRRRFEARFHDDRSMGLEPGRTLADGLRAIFDTQMDGDAWTFYTLAHALLWSGGCKRSGEQGEQLEKLLTEIVAEE